MSLDISKYLVPNGDSDSEDIPDEIEYGSDEEVGQKSTASAESEAMPDLDSDDERLEEVFQSLPQKQKTANSFASMGLDSVILKNLLKKGFRQPTPIQRKTILPILEGNDVVGMARTGSGKTAAFVLPLIQKLKAHSARVGARAMILSPSRELAVQTLRVVKEFSRNTDLRCVLLVGGDSLDEQFGAMMNNPDIIIATPGRFMHIKVEMSLSLGSMEYVVFDEADRLFEMGFAEQLNEIIASLPESRQTHLFSATLPPSLVDFAKAGLQNPVLIRLDADQRVSEELEMAFFSTKDSERDATLLYILQEIIKMPLATPEQLAYLKSRESIVYDEDGKLEKRERLPSASALPSPSATIVFVPTKHHVEYITGLLKNEEYSVSHIYGSLDQAARREQLHQFKTGKTSIMVVTDVAARGVDIPLLANVINYNMTSSPRIFVHRVGRTARAGNRGWAYSIIKQTDLPYLAELELFLGKPLVCGSEPNTTAKDYRAVLHLGTSSRQEIEFFAENITSLLKRDFELNEMKKVADRGEKLYLKSRGSASKRAVARGREIFENGWDRLHPLAILAANENQTNKTIFVADEKDKEDLLASFGKRKSKDTVFETKKGVGSAASQLMARRRDQIAPIQERARRKRELATLEKAEAENLEQQDLDESVSMLVSKPRASTSGSVGDEGSTLSRFRDSKFYMSYDEPVEMLQERGYAIDSGNSFSSAAKHSTVALDGEGGDYNKKQITKWDKKKGKYINTTGENKVKYIRGEDGRKIPASLKTGRFESWKEKHKFKGLGATEVADSGNSFGQTDNKFKHKKLQAPKPADKARDDFKKRKTQVENALGRGLRVKGHTLPGTELKSSKVIQKQRSDKQKKWERSNQPGRKSPKGGKNTKRR